ncbi:MAG: class I SAM-dependent methyltransferase [Alphaproteobacteria bacterium]
MLESNITEDKAGNEYWSGVWQNQDLPKTWDMESLAIKDYVKHSFFIKFKESFAEFEGRENVAFVEVGCARSQILPVFAKSFNFDISGIDYSKVGCEQASAILERDGVKGKVYCCDIFNIPDDLVGKFDVVLSIGLIEHFADTKEIVVALSKLLKPKGIMFTNVPNMTKCVGFLQKIFDKKVYDIHIPLDKNKVETAHKDAGLEVIDCSYFLFSNFLVLNLNSTVKKSFIWWLKKLFLNGLVAFSILTWVFERTFKIKLKANSYFSPYINCIARKKD